VTALFREIEFNCRHCPEKFTNSGFQNHQWDCVGQTFGCLLELCDRSNLTLQGLLDHGSKNATRFNLLVLIVIFLLAETKYQAIIVLIISNRN
jgi:hypothetical protein